MLGSDSCDEDGKFGGIWISGNLTFGTIVIVSNMKILISSYQVSIFNVFLVMASTLVYILFYTTISSGITVSNDFGTFYMLMSAPQTYFALLLFTFMFVLIDSGSIYLNIYINKWQRAHIRKHQKLLEKKNKSSKSVVRSKVTKFKSKCACSPLTFPSILLTNSVCLLWRFCKIDRGFAFSQAPGNDRLVTDTLSGRIANAMYGMIEKNNMITFDGMVEADESPLLPYNDKI